MKAHTNDYKNAIKEFGREISAIITYEDNNETIILDNNDLNSISSHYEGAILKSVMRQLDIETTTDIPEGTELNCQFGVKVGNDYEYLNFGNYIVYKNEQQKDTYSYKLTCYDKMLYSMVDYIDLGIEYPITIRDYISAIASHLGLTFKNENDTSFANWNKEIPNEKYLDSEGNSLGYTFRNVLDELAQVTASTICINEDDDELEIRYINNTLDTINEEYFKDANVNIGELYGPINTIVLSRSGGADNIYYPSTLPENPNEIKIEDNQIMNGNDRDTYMPDIYSKLNGLQYYLNDYASTGVTYYNLCDRYNIQIGEDTYSCVMFNDEVNITQGLEENVHTDLPENSVTDYTKADKTDMRINQTYLIVDKQNQQIESVISNVGEQDEKISQITQTVDELNAKIGEVADVTVTGESDIGYFELDDINTSEPIMVKIRPIGTSISYLYPRSNLYPSSSLYSTNRKIRFENISKYEQTTDIYYNNYRKYYSYDDITYTLLVAGTDYIIGDEIIGDVYQNVCVDYELPDDLLYYNSTTYDEFLLDYENQICQVTKKCKYNADGTVGLLNNPEINTYDYPTIILDDGDYVISLLGYNTGYIYTRLMASNIYTTQFATKVEMNSAITQKANEISLVVNQKLDEEDFTHAEIVAKINDDTSQVKIGADKVNIQSSDVINLLAGNTINLSSKSIAIDSNKFKVTTDGDLTCSNANITGGNMEIVSTEELPKFKITAPNYNTITTIYGTGYNLKRNDTPYVRYGVTSNTLQGYYGRFVLDNDIGNRLDANARQVNMYSTTNSNTITLSGQDGYIYCTDIVHRSKESIKKNFEKLDNALDIIKNTDIYKYNFKTEDDKSKKHIGLVIGKKYKYPKEVTINDEGVDVYALTSICCQAIKEQQEQIEKLKKEIEKLKESEK